MAQLQLALLREAVHDYQDKRGGRFPPKCGGGDTTALDPAVPEQPRASSHLQIMLQGHLEATRWRWGCVCHAKLGGAGLDLA